MFSNKKLDNKKDISLSKYNKKISKISSITIILVIFSTIILSIVQTKVYAYDDSLYVWSDDTKTVETSANIGGESSKVNTLPTTADQTGNFLNLTCGAAVLIDQDTGTVLYEHNSHEKLRPASVTKVMTILLIMEAIDSGQLKYTDKISCSANASNMGGSQIWLDESEELTVDEMLKAICVVSANDCVIAMAEHLAGAEEAFVQKMNERAKELGMNDTTFKNAHGLDTEGHLTSAYDIALMSRELLSKHPDITKYTTIWMDTLRDGKSQLVNTNKLIKTYNGATGLKTGSTSLALYNLSASATRDGFNLIGVILKAENSKVRFAEAKQLLDYGFSTYTYKQFAKKGEIVNSINVEKGVLDTVNVIYENDARSLVKKGEEAKIEQEIMLDMKVNAPINKGQKLGEVVYTLNGKEVGKTSLVAEEGVKKLNYINSASFVFWKWFSLFR